MNAMELPIIKEAIDYAKEACFHYEGNDDLCHTKGLEFAKSKLDRKRLKRLKDWNKNEKS